MRAPIITEIITITLDTIKKVRILSKSLKVRFLNSPRMNNTMNVNKVIIPPPIKAPLFVVLLISWGVFLR